ncbi:DUF1905 domain-containing protein [Brucepastera parasyntrophica]|uniref:DUF1905 domain-containing protein n=1 Tax=Brucepastera parasyntrophica TaxID=2880008 RepID=UPI002108B392|nr:DUF1905 domain-containing protein [Brucepastera parasyntrophica]ULQ61013.1 DUF1905 domain-containing protein [Brucepastera parasyntrophica]
MKSKRIQYEFSAKVLHYSSSGDMCGWYVVFLPKELAKDIRKNFKFLEEGWGRMKTIVKIGNSEWETAIWFDTKHDTYLLPLKAEIRKKEKIEIDKEIEIIIWV